jgi:hypothetical protein
MMPQGVETNSRLLNRSESALTKLEVAKVVGISIQSIKRWIKVLEEEFDYRFEKTDEGDRKFYSHDIALFQELKGYIKIQRWQIRDSVEYIFQSKGKVIPFSPPTGASVIPQQHPLINDIRMILDDFKRSVSTKEDMFLMMKGIEQVTIRLQSLEEQFNRLEHKLSVNKETPS